MATNGKQKGNRGEREVIKLIQGWWQAIEPGSQFFRTPGSGSLATNLNLVGKKFSGDVSFNEHNTKRFKYSIEVKFRKTITYKAIENFKNNKRSSIKKYWEQCKEGAKRDNLEPMLFFRGNNIKWHIAFIVNPDDVPEYQVITIDTLLNTDPEQFALPVGADRS